MREWSKKAFEVIRRRLDNELSEGTWSAQLADLAALKKNALELLPMAAIALTHGFPAKETSPQKPLIVLTEAENDERSCND